MEKTFIEKKYWQQLPIYGYNLYVIVSTDINKSRIKRNKEIGREWEEDGTTRALHCGVTDKGVSYIFIPYNASINEIVHESTHCLQRIIEWIGATYRDPEFVAYLMGYLADAVSEFVNHFIVIYEKELDKLEKAG